VLKEIVLVSCKTEIQTCSLCDQGLQNHYSSGFRCCQKMIDKLEKLTEMFCYSTPTSVFSANQLITETEPDRVFPVFTKTEWFSSVFQSLDVTNTHASPKLVPGIDNSSKTSSKVLLWEQVWLCLRPFTWYCTSKA
jgi:hypothetical protein